QGDRDPYLLQDLEAQRGAPVEQDVAGAEYEDELVQRGIRAYVDQPRCGGTERDAGQEEHDDVGYVELLRQKSRQRAPEEQYAEDEDDMLGQLGRDARVQFPLLSKRPSMPESVRPNGRSRHWRPGSPVIALRAPRHRKPVQRVRRSEGLGAPSRGKME